MYKIFTSLILLFWRPFAASSAVHLCRRPICQALMLSLLIIKAKHFPMLDPHKALPDQSRKIH